MTRIEVLAVAALLAVYTAMAWGEAVHQSVTVDEFHLLPQAIALRATGDLELGYKTPPLLKRWVGLAVAPSEVELPDPNVDGKPAADGWAPWIFGTRFMLKNAGAYDRLFLRARLLMLPLGWLLGLAIFLWARRVRGTAAGLAALTLFAFSPEMVAYTSLVSLDLAVTLLAVGLLFLMREHLRTRRWLDLVGSAALFGLGLAVKLSVIVLAPVFLLPLVLTRRPRVLVLLVVVGVSLLALHASYGFDRPLVRWGDFEPKSRSFRALHARLPDAVRVPLPLLWLRALDGQARDAQTADVPSYLDGEWSDRGWHRYYLMAWLYKTPLPVLGLVLIAAGSAFLPRARSTAPGPSARPLPPWLDASLIAGPILLWGGSFSMARGLDIGIRYVLPCYALGAVGLGVILSRIPRRSAWGGVAGALLASLVVVSVAAYPHHLSYFNRIGGGERGAYRHLVDSNLDWGQELKHVARYLRDRKIERIGLGYFGHVAPELYGIDYFVPEGPPAPGWYAISANFLAGYPYLVYDHGRLRPVRDDHFAAFRSLDPVDTIAGALMIYQVR